MGLLPLPTSSHSIRLTLAASAACRRKQEAIERSHGRLQGHVALKSGVVPGGSTSGGKRKPFNRRSCYIPGIPGQPLSSIGVLRTNQLL